MHISHTTSANCPISSRLTSNFQIFGFATTLVGYIAVLLHVVQVKYLSRPDIEFKSFLRHARIIRVVVNQLFLILSVVTSLLGFGSLSSVALCIPQVLPFAMTVSFGFGLAGLSPRLGVFYFCICGSNDLGLVSDYDSALSEIRIHMASTSENKYCFSVQPRSG